MKVVQVKMDLEDGQKENNQLKEELKQERHKHEELLRKIELDKLADQEDLRQRDEKTLQLVQKLESEYRKSLEELKRENEGLKKNAMRSLSYELGTEDHPEVKQENQIKEEYFEDAEEVKVESVKKEEEANDEMEARAEKEKKRDKERIITEEGALSGE